MPTPGTPAPTSSVPAVWRIADRYRLLVAPAQRTVTMQGLRERLAPARRDTIRLLQHALDEGTSVSPLPAPAYVPGQIVFALMEGVNDELLSTHEAGRSAAVTTPTAAGVPATLATALVT